MAKKAASKKTAKHVGEPTVESLRRQIRRSQVAHNEDKERLRIANEQLAELRGEIAQLNFTVNDLNVRRLNESSLLLNRDQKICDLENQIRIQDGKITSYVDQCAGLITENKRLKNEVGHLHSRVDASDKKKREADRQIAMFRERMRNKNGIEIAWLFDEMFPKPKQIHIPIIYGTRGDLEMGGIFEQMFFSEKPTAHTGGDPLFYRGTKQQSYTPQKPEPNFDAARDYFSSCKGVSDPVQRDLDAEIKRVEDALAKVQKEMSQLLKELR